jgi:hypothetical protein
MEITAIFVAIISLIGSLYATYLNKDKILSETYQIHMNTTKGLLQELRSELDRQKETIQSLREEIDVLKLKEKLSIDEQVRLELKIEKLTIENTQLLATIEDNKLIYTTKMSQLDNQIDKLKKELNKYTHKKDEKSQ